MRLQKNTFMTCDYLKKPLSVHSATISLANQAMHCDYECTCTRAHSREAWHSC
jgi:hypothetical protein